MTNARPKAPSVPPPPPRGSPGADAQKPHTVVEILAHQFEALRSAGTSLDRTAAAEAQYLGISASYLSRIRGQKAQITDELAQKIAARLQPDDDVRRKALYHQLLEARDAGPGHAHSPTEPDISPNAIVEFFERIAQPGSLLCVEYRDLPQAISTGPFPKMAVEAAYAIANGLSFAMFQPFGPLEELRQRFHDAIDKEHPCMRLYEYLFKLASRVRQVYREMLAEVESHSTRLGQLVLYEADSTRNGIIPYYGIQSRIFYAEYTHALTHFTEVYDWIAGDQDRHYFIRRGGTSLDPEAVSSQFHPITTSWVTDRHLSTRRLPTTNEELEGLHKRFRTKSDPNLPRWKVWYPETKDQ